MKPLQFSFSMLEAEDQCPEKARHLYVLRDYKRSWTKATSTGVDLHQALEDRVKKQVPLPGEAQSFEPLVMSFERHGRIEAEAMLGVDKSLRPISFWDAWLRGKSDVLVRIPEQRRAILGDWKSGRADYEKELQLEIGALLLMATDESIDQVLGVNVYLKTKKPGRLYTFARQDLQPRWAKLIKRCNDIEQRDASIEWEKRPGPLCPSCPTKSCEHYKGG